MEDVLIMSASRAYEYRQDDIRLTLLSNRVVIQHIQQAFAFESAAAAQPMETFGAVQRTLPPGLIFDYGIAPYPEGSATPIRFIHIEPARIVIDVAGPSSVIDATFEQLMNITTNIVTSEGTPAVASPEAIRDYSDIRFRAEFVPQALISRGIYEAVETSLGSRSNDRKTLVPALQLRLANPDENYSGAGTPHHEEFMLDLRAGTFLDEAIYYSGAPLDTDTHLRLLTEIETILLAQNQGRMLRAPSSCIDTPRIT